MFRVWMTHYMFASRLCVCVQKQTTSNRWQACSRTHLRSRKSIVPDHAPWLSVVIIMRLSDCYITEMHFTIHTHYRRMPTYNVNIHRSSMRYVLSTMNATTPPLMVLLCWAYQPPCVQTFRNSMSWMFSTGTMMVKPTNVFDRNNKIDQLLVNFEDMRVTAKFYKLARSAKCELEHNANECDYSTKQRCST